MSNAAPKSSGLFSRIKQALGGLGFRLGHSTTKKIEEELEKELKRAPCIALLGEAGVGKSSTLNALFNAGAPIDHIHPCTLAPSEHFVLTEMEGSHGPIRVFDMPGLGQDLETDAAYLKHYSEILPRCDVALWVLDGRNRAYSMAQISLRGIVAAAMKGLDRLVIGINKIDGIEPDNWNQATNLPSGQQKKHIQARVKDVVHRLGKELGLDDSRVIPFSAKKNYRLKHLLNAMMDACPKERRWVLHDRIDPARYEDLVDPRILKELKQQGKKKR